MGGQLTLARIELRAYVVTLEDDGAIAFAPRATDGGAEASALRLASVEPPETWRLVAPDPTLLVLAMGDWLVWIDGEARKVLRRVRASAKVKDLVAEGDKLVARLEGGLTQTFHAVTGEPKVASPLTALAARGDLVVAGDRAGRVRIVRGEADAGGLSIGDAVVGLHVTKREMVVVASARVLVRAPKPWSAPRPVAVKSAPIAFAGDDAYAFCGTSTGGVDVYELESGRHVTSHALSQDDRITALCRLPGALLVVGTGALDGRVLFVDLVAAKIVHRVSPHQDAFGVTCLAADARGRIVASGGDDGTVVLLDPAKGRVLARLRVREAPAALAFEPTGRRLACVFADGTAAIIALTAKGAAFEDVRTRSIARVVWGPGGPVFGLADGSVSRGGGGASALAASPDAS